MKTLALIVGFMLSTGIFVPWIINNDIMPIWLSLVIFCCFMFLWFLILEKPIVRASRKLLAILKDLE